MKFYTVAELKDALHNAIKRQYPDTSKLMFHSDRESNIQLMIVEMN